MNARSDGSICVPAAQSTICTPAGAFMFNRWNKLGITVNDSTLKY